MSSWYVWAALGLYPGLPGGAELLVGSPLFPQAVIHRADGVTITILAPGAAADRPFVHGLSVDGRPWAKPWLPESFVSDGGELRFDLSSEPNLEWATGRDAAPPSLSDGG
jgi:putative alpha-1,2-mannosidase